MGSEIRAHYAHTIIESGNRHAERQRPGKEPQTCNAPAVEMLPGFFIFGAMLVTVNLDPNSPKFNPKQRKFFDDVMRAVSNSQQHEIIKRQIKDYPEDGDIEELEALVVREAELSIIVENDYRYFFYGGAVSGGKTIISIGILCILATAYPCTRWHIIRKDMSVIEQTTVPSMEEVLHGCDGIRWVKNRKGYFVQFPNGSRIYFIGENYERDKDMNKFKGLPSNGFLLEQGEELQFQTFDKAIERAGRWTQHIGIKPPPFVFVTFNPTYGWLKKNIHDKHVRGELKKPYYYLQALPDDNKYNTAEQWRGWEHMDPETYDRFIRGNWDIKVSGAFFYAFTEARNVKPVEIDWRYDLWISFDFNVDPMTATMCQSDGFSFARVIREYRMEDSDTYEICRQIKADIQGREHVVKITGDASGSNRMSGARGHINHYQIIQTELGLKWEQFEVPTVNPGISDSRIFMNSIIYRLPEFSVDPTCRHLIEDLKFLETDLDRDGKVVIKKTGVNKSLAINNNQIGHLSDTVRYFAHVTLFSWLKIPKS